MSKKLMIVDDSRVVYASMSKMLENSGWEIAQFCRSGEEALKTYPDIQPDVVTMTSLCRGWMGWRLLAGYWKNGRPLKSCLYPHWPTMKWLHSPMLWVQRVSSTSRSIGKSS